jgi:HK97 family phage major capsid protein
LFSENGAKLAGYPVNVMTQMAAFGSSGDVLFGNFAEGYTVAQKGDIILSRSTDYAFLTDEVVLRATLRYMGAPSYRRYAGRDAVNVAAFASSSGT